MKNRSILIAAHRGGADLWPENSLLAFRNAIALGVDLLELDVRLSRDGELVVIHDATLERTTNGAGQVAERDAADLAQLSLRGPDGALNDEGVPTLSLVLELVRPTPLGLLVEIKSPSEAAWYERDRDGVRAIGGPRYEGVEERVVRSLVDGRMRERVTVMAFNPDVLRRVRQLDGSMRTALLVSQNHVAACRAVAADTAEWARAVGATDLGLDHAMLDANVVNAAHDAGLGVGVWTANLPEAIQRACDLGVDALTTDRPDLALQLIRGEPHRAPTPPLPTDT